MRILIAQQDPQEKMRLMGRLERAGHRARLAQDGLEAVALIAADCVDVLLLAEDLETDDGLQLLKWLGANRPDLPVVFYVPGGDEALSRAWAATAPRCATPEAALSAVAQIERGIRTGRWSRFAPWSRLVSLAKRLRRVRPKTRGGSGVQDRNGV